jgi:hypothetical protein
VFNPLPFPDKFGNHNNGWDRPPDPQRALRLRYLRRRRDEITVKIKTLLPRCYHPHGRSAHMLAVLDKIIALRTEQRQLLGKIQALEEGQP